MSESTATGLELAIALTEFGAQIREQRYRREHPMTAESEVEDFMHAWWMERPGAPFGDSAGRPIPVPRPRG